MKQTQEGKRFYAEKDKVKLIGRTVMKDGTLWLALSASGIEFTFEGTSAKVEIIGDNMISLPEKRARFAVYIDEKKTMDEMVDSAKKSYEIFCSDIKRKVTVKVLKLSEAAESMMGIGAITVNGSDIKPAPEKGFKIEFIGDSITCGYGVDDENAEHHFKTATEDATKGYAYKTAALLNADYSLVSYSGHGIISGFTENGKKITEQRVPPFYEIFAKSYGSVHSFCASAVSWDFSKFVPDIVVINLGTNDASYTGNDKEKIEEYRRAYYDFLKTVRKHNPNAHIICALGIMGDSLFPILQSAVKKYSEETNDNNISCFHFNPQDGSTGYAADWHPSEATHDIAAKALAEEIKSIISKYRPIE